MNKKSNYIEITDTEIIIPIKVKQRWQKQHWESLNNSQRKKVFRGQTSVPLSPGNLVVIKNKYSPADFPQDDTLSNCIKYHQCKLASFELEFVREKEFVRFRVPFDQINLDTFDHPSEHKDWNAKTNYYEISGGSGALAKYGELFSQHFSDHPDYHRLLAAFDFGGGIPNRRIQLSGDSCRFKIYFEYDLDLIDTVKKYRAKWDNRHRIWNAPVGMNAVVLAKELRSQGFMFSEEVTQLIERYDSERPFSYEVNGEQIILRNLARIEVHSFLAPRKEATFESKSETWTIKPNYEISKFLTQSSHRGTDKNARFSVYGVWSLIPVFCQN